MVSNFKKNTKNFILKHFPIFFSYKNAINARKHYIINTKKFGYWGKHSHIGLPTSFATAANIFIGDYVRIQDNSKIINYTGKFIVKKYSAIGVNLVAVSGNHRPTVGIPQFILGPSHINDTEGDIIVEESVWVGANVTLLHGSQIGRGAIVGACSLVNKPIPPYAVAVGAPVKIIASVFTIDQIIEHERIIYPPEERFSREYLTELFAENFQEKKAIGISSMSEENKVILENMKKKLDIPNYE